MVVAAYAVLFYFRRRPDQRAFILSVTGKICIGCLFVLFLSIAPEDDGPSGMSESLFAFIVFSFGPSLLIASLGMVRLARIPCCGPLIAGLAGPGTSCRGFQLINPSDQGLGDRWGIPVSRPDS